MVVTIYRSFSYHADVSETLSCSLPPVDEHSKGWMAFYPTGLFQALRESSCGRTPAIHATLFPSPSSPTLNKARSDDVLKIPSDVGGGEGEPQSLRELKWKEMQARCAKQQCHSRGHFWAFQNSTELLCSVAPSKSVATALCLQWLQLFLPACFTLSNPHRYFSLDRKLKSNITKGHQCQKSS